MPDLLRLFIAIELSEEIRHNLAEVVREMQAISPEGIRWVNAANIHLTLKFLGDTPRGNVDGLCSLLKQTTAELAPFALTVCGTGCFPTPRQPRVFWAGVESTSALNEVQHKIDQALRTLQIPPEKRAFSPHLTLARVSARVSDKNDNPFALNIYARLMNYQEKAFGAMEVTQVTLFQSTLARGGSLYTPLTRVPLGKAN